MGAAGCRMQCPRDAGSGPCTFTGPCTSFPPPAPPQAGWPPGYNRLCGLQGTCRPRGPWRPHAGSDAIPDSPPQTGPHASMVPPTPSPVGEEQRVVGVGAQVVGLVVHRPRRVRNTQGHSLRGCGRARRDCEIDRLTSVRTAPRGGQQEHVGRCCETRMCRFRVLPARCSQPPRPLQLGLQDRPLRRPPSARPLRTTS